MAVETVFFVIVFLIVGWLLLSLLQRLRKRTRRKGSKYYVPTFRAHFDSWESKWTMSRRMTVDRDKAQWQQEYDR